MLSKSLPDLNILEKASSIPDGRFPRFRWISDMLNADLPTPFFYDVVHFDTIADEDFKKRIAQEGKIIYERI